MSLTYTRLEEKAEQEAQLAADIEAFLQSGNEIQKIPIGVMVGDRMTQRQINSVLYREKGAFKPGRRSEGN